MLLQPDKLHISVFADTALTEIVSYMNSFNKDLQLKFKSKQGTKFYRYEIKQFRKIASYEVLEGYEKHFELYTNNSNNYQLKYFATRKGKSYVHYSELKAVK